MSHCYAKYMAKIKFFECDRSLHYANFSFVLTTAEKNNTYHKSAEFLQQLIHLLCLIDFASVALCVYAIRQVVVKHG